MDATGELLRRFYTQGAGTGKRDVSTLQKYLEAEQAASRNDLMNRRRSTLDMNTYNLAEDTLAETIRNNQQMTADAEANRNAQAEQGKTSVITNLAGTAALTDLLSKDSTLIKGGKAAKDLVWPSTPAPGNPPISPPSPAAEGQYVIPDGYQMVDNVVPNVVDYAAQYTPQAAQTGAEFVASQGTAPVGSGYSSLYNVADPALSTGTAGAFTPAAEGGFTAAELALANNGATVFGGEVAPSLLSQGASKVGSAISSVAAPVAVVGAFNMARDAWGAPNKKWTDPSKTESEKFFDDPLIGLASNNAGGIFGKGSSAAEFTNKVGDTFSNFAGGPISKAFSLDFPGALNQLTTAPSAGLQNFGVDKGTADNISKVIDPAGTIYQAASSGDTKQVIASVLGIPGAANTCIVYGHLYGPTSKQVRTALVFCAKEMTESKLIGYYSIGKKMINIWKKHPKIQESMGKAVVVPFYNYMRWKIGKGEKPSLMTRILAPAFLQACRAYYYSGLPKYMPEGYVKCVKSTKDRKWKLQEA
jgi:hypothetical protein